MSEKRIKPRMHRRIPLTVGLRFEGAALGEGHLMEMSEGGLSFATESTLNPGDRLTLQISDDAGLLSLEGVVLHGHERDGETVYGVRFDSVTDQQRQLTRDLLRRHRFERFRNPV